MYFLLKTGTFQRPSGIQRPLVGSHRLRPKKVGSVFEWRAVADLFGSPRSPALAIETINGSLRQHGCFVMFQCVPVLLVSSLLKWIGRNGLTLKLMKEWQVQSPWSLHFLSTTVDCMIWTIFVCLTLFNIVMSFKSKIFVWLVVLVVVASLSSWRPF